MCPPCLPKETFEVCNNIWICGFTGTGHSLQYTCDVLPVNCCLGLSGFLWATSLLSRREVRD